MISLLHLVSKHTIARLALCSFVFLSAICIPNKAQSIDIDKVGIDSTLLWVKKNIEEHPNQSKSMLTEVIALSKVKKDLKTQGEAHSTLAKFYHDGSHDSEGAQQNFKEAITCFKQLGDQKRVAALYQTLSKSYSFNNKHKLALEAIFKSLEIYEIEKDEVNIARCYSNLCEIYYPIEEWEKAIEYGEKAIVLLKKHGEEKEIAFTERALSPAYRMTKEYDKAMQSLTKAMVYVTNHRDEVSFITLPDLYNRRGLINKYLKKYDLAIADYQEALRLVNEKPENQQFNISAYQINLARIYELQGKFPESIKLLHEAEKFADESGETYNARALYEGLAYSYQANGNNKKAFEYLEGKLLPVIASSYTDKIKTLESELEIKYDTEKKDETISSQDSQIAQQQKIQSLSYGILGLLLALSGGLIFGFRKNKQKNQLLNTKNKQNEVLLKEIHHRVKNNLQTISSLLNLQSDSIQDPTALDAVQESQNRVASMAMIHQKLYQGENLAAIEMRDYFQTIGKAIIKSFGEKAKGVELKVDMPKLELDVDTAIPIGLITNELLTNSLKHAFTLNGKGKISISMHKEGNGLVELKIADNGTNSSAHTLRENGFGTMLIELLTSQLEGKMEQSTVSGTETKISFTPTKQAA